MSIFIAKIDQELYRTCCKCASVSSFLMLLLSWNLMTVVRIIYGNTDL